MSKSDNKDTRTILIIFQEMKQKLLKNTAFHPLNISIEIYIETRQLICSFLEQIN